MAKLNLNNKAGGQKPSQSDVPQSRGDKIFALIQTGIQDVNTLAATFNTVNSSIDNRKKTDTDNAVKLSKAETEAKKEENRHNEEMAKIEREWKKITDAAEDRERRLSFIQGQIQRFQTEYDKYMNMETEDFLSDTVTARLESLRKVIMELTKELNRA